MTLHEMAPHIPILYRDDHLLIINKPPQILVHPNPKDRQSADCITILSRVLHRKIYTVHRIDRGTSGIVAFALNPEAADGVAEQFRERRARKRYFAVVRGHITERTVVDKPVKRGLDGVLADARSIIHPVSTTVFPEPVGPYEEAWYSFVEVELETGRTHQARKHLKSLSRPVLGDNRNGDRTHNRFIRDRFDVPFMFLRSYALSFSHPMQAATVAAVAGFPDWWLNTARALGISIPEVLIREPAVEIS
jgi:tRNA pseudouridine65 synthase